MEKKSRKKKKAFVSADDCVACGSCLKVCPRNALEIWHGIMARVDMERCIGCGKCAKECPASVIVIQEAEA
nr:4Fe-4S binding protein [uncultured Blautia sp.]